MQEFDMEDGTADRILDVVQTLIQTRGFNAISYRDVAEAIGIRKASIHYHFPSKMDLGRAVIARYRERLEQVRENINPVAAASYVAAWKAYLAPIAGIASVPGAVCLCGALAGEFQTLSDEMQSEVRLFFEGHQSWLSALFEDGRHAGAFQFEGSPDAAARLIFSALEGGLLIHRALADETQVNSIVGAVESFLGLHRTPVQ
ncbi:MAG: TetR/AcrR family transcriptional regulator [Pseudomonadota bacterium]